MQQELQQLRAEKDAAQAELAALAGARDAALAEAKAVKERVRPGGRVLRLAAMLACRRCW
jgi:DNA-binding XRE family transcriptional regulator